MAEAQLTALRHQLHNSADISQARATEAEKREQLLKKKFETLQAAFIGGIRGGSMGSARTPQEQIVSNRAQSRTRSPQ